MGDVEQRLAHRIPTDLEAVCRMAGQAWPARLRNISTSGCMIACPEGGLPEGGLMRLRISGLHAIDAEVVWRHRGHVGLRFLLPLQVTSLEHLGSRLPETARPCATQNSTAGLHAGLVKRAEGDPLGTPATA